MAQADLCRRRMSPNLMTLKELVRRTTRSLWLEWTHISPTFCKLSHAYYSYKTDSSPRKPDADLPISAQSAAGNVLVHDWVLAVLDVTRPIPKILENFLHQRVSKQLFWRDGVAFQKARHKND